MSSRRQLRLAGLLQRELGEMIALELKDPRLEFVSVTRVDVTGDLRHARVYVSHLGDEQSSESVVAALDNASGYMKRQLGQRIKLRHMPELDFRFDEGLLASQEMNLLLDQLAVPDETASPDEPAADDPTESPTATAE